MGGYRHSSTTSRPTPGEDRIFYTVVITIISIISCGIAWNLWPYSMPTLVNEAIEDASFVGGCDKENIKVVRTAELDGNVRVWLNVCGSSVIYMGPRNHPLRAWGIR